LKPVIVYGPIPDEGNYAFLEEPHARDSLACWSAFNTARTWREFWAKLPQRYHSRVDHPGHIDPELYAPEDVHPVDDTPFDGARLDPEGEFPPLAHTEAAAEWMPEDIVERYGSFQNGWMTDTWIVYRVEHAEAVANELRRRGYEVKRDDELIKYTCSYHAALDH